MKRLHQFIDVEHLHQDVCARLLTVARDCQASAGSFHLVLAGGSTPMRLYQLLREQPSVQWSGWHIYFSDERLLPTNDPARNDQMAKHAWLDHVAIPERQIHRIEATANPREAARQYERLLVHSPKFDLVLLGLGEDGHTASLFPGDSNTPPGCSDAVPVLHAPIAPPERVSMSAERLNRADRIWFLVTGAGKRPAMEAWLQGGALPASQIQISSGIDIFTDQYELSLRPGED